MTKTELIELMKDMPDDASVVFQVVSGCCGDREDMTVIDTDTTYPKMLVITFDSLPGYRSCIQVGGTKKADDEWMKKYGK